MYVCYLKKNFKCYFFFKKYSDIDGVTQIINLARVACPKFGRAFSLEITEFVDAAGMLRKKNKITIRNNI